MSYRERGDREGGVRVRVGEDRDGYRRHRRHFRVYGGDCRTIVIKKRYHGEVVIRRVRRCD